MSAWLFCTRMTLLKKSSSQTMLVFILIGFAFSLSLSLCFILNSYLVQPKEEEKKIPALLSLGLPVRLKIPEIGVNAAIDSLGLTPDGSMDIPKGPNDVAWFNLGHRPGENGSAVIAGHYGTWKNGQGSVFDNLHKLSKGDMLYIGDDNGSVISFTVREIIKYDPKADTADIFSSDDGKAHLNLITCEGTWNKNSKSYSERLVVFTDRVE